MREVSLYGAHAETFRLEVDSPAEAVRAIITLRPHLREHIRTGYWSVVIGPLDGGYPIGQDELHANAGHLPIHFVPELHVAGGKGGGIGKIILGAVLIATAIINPFGLIAAAGSAAIITTTTVLGFGVSMVLGGAAMLLSPTPKAPRASDQTDPEERPSFFFNGAVNISEPGVPVPLAYGYFRCGSVVINAGIWNEDLAAEEVTAAAALGLTTRIEGRGPAGILALAPEPIRRGPPRALARPAAWDAELFPTLTTEALLLGKGGGKGGSPGAAYSPREAKNTLRSRSLVRIHEILSEGPIKGPPDPGNWGRYVYLDGTQLTRDEGGWNFQVAAAYLRSGIAVETPIPGFPASEATRQIGVQLKKGFPVTRRVESPDATLIRVAVRTPSMLKQEDNGDVNPTYADFRIEYMVEGQAWVHVTDNRMDGKTTTGYERNISFWLPARTGAPIDVRLSRLTDDATTLKLRNDLYWTMITEIIDGTMRHDDSAAAAFVLDAEQFPSIPKRAYEFYWLMVSVPSNYDPYARTYAGDWDGAFKLDWTNNPAWILYDLLTNTTHGLGRDLDATTVDKWSFYDAARYNDESVPNGLGGAEPRFTFNGVLNTVEDAASVLQAVASCMRAQIYVAGGVVMLAQDRPPPAFDRIFTRANVADGNFDYQSTEHRSRITTANVNWIDPGRDWSPTIEPVPYPEMMGRFGYRELGITAVGCTSRGQAIRAGRYFLFSAHHEQEIVSFIVGLENADLRPGDIIGIHDPARASVDWGGRVVGRAGTHITVDREVEGTPAGTLYIAAEGAPIGAAVQGLTIVRWPAPNVVEVNATEAELAGIGPGAVWAVSNATVNIRQWRVLALAEQEGFRFQVTAAVHDSRKYTYVESGVTLPDLSYNYLPSGPLAPPTDLAAEDYYSLDPSGAPRAGLLFSWTPSLDARVLGYVADGVGPGHVGEHFPVDPGTSVVILVAETGEWTLSCYGVDALGRRSPVASIVVNTAALARVPLPPLNFFAGQAVGYSAYLTWNAPDDYSVAYWWLKWTPDLAAPKWDSALTVQSTIPARLLSLVVPAQTGTFLLKSVSVRGVESATFAYAFLQLSDLRPVAVSRIEQPDWLGTKTNCYVNLGELWMDAPTALDVRRHRTEGPWPPPLAVPVPFERPPHIAARVALASMEYITPPLTLTQAAEVISRLTLAGRGVIADDIMANWIPLAVANPLSRTASADWEATAEESYRTTAGGAWSDWQPAGVANLVVYEVRYRLLGAVYAVGVSLRFSRMEEALLLVPFDQSGVATSNAGGVVTVPFNPDYYQQPIVTAQARGAAAVQVLITAASGTQFTANTLTPAGAVAPNVTFDWQAQGYGRLP